MTTVSSIDGVERRVAFRKLPNLPVYVFAGLETNAIRAAWQAQMGAYLLVGLPATAALIAIVLLLLIILAFALTGYLLPWDQLAFWAITVGASIAGYAPVVGKQVQFLLLGDTVVGQEALLRFYVLHIAVLPVVMMILVMVHFWRIRKDGGISGPL